MALTTHKLGDWLVVSLRGNLDLATIPNLQSEFQLLVQTGETQIVLDLDYVELLGSMALGLILDLARRTRLAGGDCRVVTTVERFRELFELTRFDHAVIVRDSLSAATLAPQFS